MTKDKRYATVKVLFETGNVSHFSDIFDIIPRSVVAADVGINYVRFTKKINDLQHFSLRDIYALADIIEIDRRLLLDLLHKDALVQITEAEARKKRKGAAADCDG